MNVALTSPASLARLLAWDVPFLPRVGDVRIAGAGADLEVEEAGVRLADVSRWPRGQRAAVALQTLAAASFLFEQGWYPSRSLLRGARVVRGDGAPAVRLTALPRQSVADGRLAGRLRRAGDGALNAVTAATGPIVRALLPERAAEFERAGASRPAWEMPEAWLELLLGEVRGAALRHPDGGGRALWGRCFSRPASGVFWLEEPTLLPVLAAALRLANLGREIRVEAGAYEQEDADRLQARAAAAGCDCLVMTTLALPGVPPLPLEAGPGAVWVFGPRRSLAIEYAVAAARAGEERTRAVRAVLEAGASGGFACPPRSGAPPRGEALASPQARRILRLLESSPVGLTAEEVIALAGPAGSSLEELQRLGLAQRRRGAWVAARARADPDGDALRVMAGTLPAVSVAGLVARALTRGEWEGACAWVEDRVEAGAFREALDAARVLASFPPLRLLAAEAALGLGRLADAEELLHGLPEGDRCPRWHALAAWWAEQAGVPERAAAECTAAAGVSGARLAARVELVASELARRRGDREAQAAHLQSAVRAVSPPPADAEFARAAAAGPAALRELGEARASAWTADEKARFFQLLGLSALDRDGYAAAFTALRAALRSASGENLRLLGEIHADLGCAAIIVDRPIVADRHLFLAERLLERCGSRRTVTLVRANRAVLACDRMDWRTCRELTLAARDVRGELDDEPTWLGEMELARAELARGDVAAVQALLPRLADGVGRHADHPVLVQALAELKAHLALALGDLPGAVNAAVAAESGERELIFALETAETGADPPAGLPQRWGVAATAQLLAAWRRGDEAAARSRLAHGLERAAREAAVGFARFAALLVRRGERVPHGWAELERAAEAVLEGDGLDGWASLLRGASGTDPVRLVRALDEVVNAGTDALAQTRLETLARALGLRSLRLERGGLTLGAWGAPDGDVADLPVGEVRVRTTGPLTAAGEAALALVARHLTSTSAEDVVSAARPSTELLGGSAALEEVRRQIVRWGPLPLNVLLTGEPGTGKELAARAIHRQSGRRGAFVPLNCAGIPASLLEAELFGVTKGAYTGADRDRAGLVEAAEGGTLFLDEVGELPIELQGKLLRLVQGREVRRVGGTRSRTVDVRFVAATNRDLEQAVAAGAFRSDLYYRLAVAVVAMPALRERPEDVEILAREFTERIAQTLNRPGVRLAPAAVDLLRRGAWPGNVRELETVLIRAIAAAKPGEVLGPDRFSGVVPSPAAATRRPVWPEALADFRRTYFAGVLRESGGNRTRAAQRAGVSRQTLLYHLRELGIRGPGDA